MAKRAVVDKLVEKVKGKRRRPKKCRKTTCGNSCIATEKKCVINDPPTRKRIQLKTVKLRSILVSSKKIANHSRLGNLSEFKDIINQLSKRDQRILLNSADSDHVIKMMLDEQDKNSSKRQWVTAEEKKAILDWYKNGQKSVVNYDLRSEVSNKIWERIKKTSPDLRKRLEIKGSAKYRFDTTMNPEERGKFILDLFIASGKCCTITGKPLDFGKLEPDHKSRDKGDTPENLILVSAQINKHKNKKTWEEYVKFLESYDPVSKEQQSKKNSVHKAALLISYVERIKNNDFDFSSPEVPKEFNQGSIAQLTKLLSTHPNGKYAIVAQPQKRTSTGSLNTAYQLLRYRLGYISFDEIPKSVWEEMSIHTSKTESETKELVKVTFNPAVDKTSVNWKFDSASS